MKNIEITDHGGLQCDNPKCDWANKSISFEDYKNWINAPCPKCGENVLTEKDYINAETVRASIDFVNSLSPGELESLNKLIGTGVNTDEPFHAIISTHENITIDVNKKTD